jgi:porphobilinogen synthase
MNFPTYRPRRLRRNEKLRSMMRETPLEPRNFIYPLFIGPGKDKAS